MLSGTTQGAEAVVWRMGEGGPTKFRFEEVWYPVDGVGTLREEAPSSIC